MPVFAGTALNDSLLGTAQADTIIGLDGNDLIDDGSGTGIDTLIGGNGNDSYYIHVAGTTVVEAADEGMDTIRTTLSSFSQREGVENLIFTGSGNFIGLGNVLDNLMIGGAWADSLNGANGDDVLSAHAGDDVLQGGAGTNTLIGGEGNDLYIVISATDTLVEAAGEGLDRVSTDLGLYRLPANFENLHHSGIGTFFGYGNALDNLIAGNAGEDFLFGYDGNDTLIGGDGPDKLYGGAGNNVLIGGGGNDIYTVESAGDTIVETANGGIDYIHVSAASYTQPANVEFMMFRGTGNFAGTGRHVTSGSGNDTLTALAVGGMFSGGAGDDIYHVGSSTSIVETSGYDRVILNDFGLSRGIFAATSFNMVAVEEIGYTGAASWEVGGGPDANIITTDAGNDRLYGYSGADSLMSGNGDDLLDGDYYFGLTAETGDVVYADGAIDTLTGGAGNDTYIIRETTDLVIEQANAGNDSVRTALAAYTLPAQVEQLFFLANAAPANTSFHGTGNDLDNAIYGGPVGDVLRGEGGNDALFGLAGNDSLFGGGGNNTLVGGAGSDAYFLGGPGDSVVEVVGEGKDTIYATSGIFSYTLGANVENFTWYGGPGSANVTGNAADNVISAGSGGFGSVISGMDGNDTLSSGYGSSTFTGGNGTDTITGGSGADQFRYIGGETGGIDTIIGFQSGSDKIALWRSGYTPSFAVDFVQGVGLPPVSTNSTFLYDSATGVISYDDDGIGAFQAVALANIGAGLTLQAGDFTFF